MKPRPQAPTMPRDVDRLHPLVLAVSGLLMARERDGSISLAAVAKTIEHALLVLAGREELRKAARDLFVFAFVLDKERGESKVAQMIVGVLNRPKLIEAMLALPPP